MRKNVRGYTEEALAQGIVLDIAQDITLDTPLDALALEGAIVLMLAGIVL